MIFEEVITSKQRQNQRQEETTSKSFRKAYQSLLNLKVEMYLNKILLTIPIQA